MLVSGLLASLLLLVHPWYDRTNDGSVYIITARSIAGGNGYTYLGELFQIRPPGFSALLAPLVGEDGRTRFVALNSLVSVFGVAGVVLLYLHQRVYVGWVLALLTSIAVWLNPGYQRLCNQVMSDVPGLALVLACLLLERWASRHPSRRREIVLGLAIGAGAYVRSILILMVPAILTSRAASRLLHAEHTTWRTFALRRLLIVAVTAWLVLLPWNVVKRLHTLPPPSDQTLNYSISTAMWHEDPGDPGSPRVTIKEIVSRAPLQLDKLLRVMGSRMQYRIPGSPPPDAPTRSAWSLVALMMLTCLLIVLVRRKAPAESFAWGALLVLAVYFSFTDRLVLPVFVFSLAATVEVSRELIRRLSPTPAATILPAAALLFLIIVDFKPRHDWDAIEARDREFASVAAEIERAMRPDAHLAAGQGFHYSVYLQRPVYSLIHAARRERRFDAVEALIEKYDLNTVVLSPLVPADRLFLEYLRQLYGPGTRAGSALVWRVRP